MKINDFTDVAKNHFCTGCGVCAGMYPETYRMVDIVQYGMRPKRLDTGKPTGHTTKDIRLLCPGLMLQRAKFSQPREREWGPIQKVFSGYATDQKIRVKASSGGIATALSLCA